LRFLRGQNTGTVFAEICTLGAVEKVEQLVHGREKQGQTRFSNCRKSSQSLFFP